MDGDGDDDGDEDGGGDVKKGRKKRVKFESFLGIGETQKHQPPPSSKGNFLISLLLLHLYFFLSLSLCVLYIFTNFFVFLFSLILGSPRGLV